MDDEIHRNIMDIFFKAPFIFKCGAETRGFEELKEARHDTTRNKHAAKCPEIERQIAAKTAHNDAKQRQRAAAIGAAVSQRAFGNIFWLEIFWQAVVGFNNCAIQIHQPRARKHAFRRNMTNFRTQYFEDNALFFTIRRKINVTAFSWQAYPTLIDMDQMRNPKPCSGTVNRNRLTFYRFCATKLNQMLFFQHRDRHRYSSKIVNNFQMAKTEILFHFGN
ncbi:hypothetical protein HmCmsJML181_01635 [Escherichia coli]|nr:hypothetical protein HmCmsJML181_01635 [Escherichia coli]